MSATLCPCTNDTSLLAVSSQSISTTTHHELEHLIRTIFINRLIVKFGD